MRRRVNFRDVQHRFTHIDATLVSAKFSAGSRKPATAEVVVRFYAWWEHPLYLQARELGTNWGFRDVDEGVRDVTVFAIDPLECHFHPGDETVTDWQFCEGHPIAWPYEDEAEVFCNSDPDIPRLIDAILAKETPFLTREILERYLRPPASKAPFSLGHFPRPLFNAVRTELERTGVRLHVTRTPEHRPVPVVFLMDGDDFIVATDFELDVPKFEHRPEWFDPSM